MLQDLNNYFLQIAGELKDITAAFSRDRTESERSKIEACYYATIQPAFKPTGVLNDTQHTEVSFEFLIWDFVKKPDVETELWASNQKLYTLATQLIARLKEDYDSGILDWLQEVENDSFEFEFVRFADPKHSKWNGLQGAITLAIYEDFEIDPAAWNS